MKEVLAASAMRVMSLLTRRDYYGLEALTGGVRLSAAEIERAIRDYGRTVVLPPAEGYELLEAIQVITARQETWAVTTPIWTAEEGISDMSIEMTIVVQAGQAKIELDDIHVL